MRYLLLPLVVLSFAVRAQTKFQLPKEPVYYKKAISFSPLALLQVDFTLMGGYEYRPKPGLGLVLEAGYIFGSAVVNSNNSDELLTGTGFIVRPALRKYIGDRQVFYVQPQLFYKEVTHRITDWLGRDCVEDVPTYSSLETFRLRRHVMGGNMVFGLMAPLSKRHKLFLDFYAGIGYRYKTEKIVDRPNCCYEPARAFFLEGEQTNFLPSLPGGVKMVFVLE